MDSLILIIAFWGLYLRLEGPSIVSKTLEISVRAGEINDLGDIECGANAGLKGSLKDQTGNSVANATVVLKDSTGQVVGTVSSDNLGNFIFENIAIGTGYKVEISKDGYDTLLLDADGKGFSVDAGFYTQITSENLIFYASLGEIKLTLKDTQINPAINPSGLSIALDSKTQKSNASGLVTFSALKSYNLMI